MSDARVAVVGGGISGLSAAYELHRRGASFVLIEKSDRLGGVIRTERADGFTIDAGPDSLVTQKPAAIALCRELGLADRLVPTRTPRTAYVVRDGVLHPLPLGSVFGIPTGIGPLAAQRLLSPRGRLRLGMELLAPRRRGDPDRKNAEDGLRDESIDAFFRRRFGPEAADYLAEPLLAGIHSGDPERLSMHALFPQFVEAEREHGSVIRAFRRNAAERAATTQRSGPFRSFPEGLETLPRALAACLPAHCLRRGGAVTTLAGGSPFVLETAGGSRITADRVVLALPAHAAAPLAAGVDGALGRLCEEFSDTSVAIVVLAFPRSAIAHPLHGSGFVVPRLEPGLSITAATWVSSKWPGRAPDDQVLLRGFVGGARRPDALALSDGALIDIVRNDLARLLGIEGDTVLARVYRWPRANPQHHVGHLARVAELDRRLARTPGLQIIGAAFRGVGIGDCVAAGRAAGAATATTLPSPP
jgi:oxygen-dependent protoporphyrinogen oxidase